MITLRKCATCFRSSNFSKWVFLSPVRSTIWCKPRWNWKIISIRSQTRAEGSNAPLENVTGCHVLQANFQMACTVAEITVLESYLPEKHVANVFTIERNNLLIDVCKMITDHILEQKAVTYWPHEENKLLK